MVLSNKMLLLFLTFIINLTTGADKVITINTLTRNNATTSVTSCTRRDHGCVGKNYSFHSFDDALSNLTSNVMINVTSDVVLSSHVYLAHLENISIFGYMNLTVKCNNIGRLYLVLCRNCSIEGILWDGCGTQRVRLIQQFNFTSLPR